ncbi:dispersed gene family protein 1 (DGF-1), putative [Trypanosoma cruzi marinkellei]|uniref:Dispersed gene family protein 1 (DGF-1), putative n=1 Tax=Trypanosoma cruzi marinkellei TaxID=85056 RepID=K2LUG7_TRYCR|nr:dispersed gene family protein 1 (DGF-1), putative [Trypanosoma cruzi marinkellei]
MSAANGVCILGVTTVSSAGLLRVADCTFFGKAEFFDPTLVFFYGSVTLQSGAQWRVEGNNVGAFSVIRRSSSQHKIKLSGAGTTVVLAYNFLVDDTYPFADLDQSNMIVVLPARFVVGCNLQGEKEASYDGVFPEDVVVFGCGTCNDDAACYMPGDAAAARQLHRGEYLCSLFPRCCCC